MGHFVTTRDYQQALGQEISQGFNKSFKDSTSCKIPGPPDVYLISKEGVRLKVHKVSQDQKKE